VWGCALLYAGAVVRVVVSSCNSYVLRVCVGVWGGALLSVGDVVVVVVV
jgi:hypothetical protein